MNECQLRILMVYDRAESRDWVFRLLTESDIGRFKVDCIPLSQLNTARSVVNTPDVCLVDASINRSTLFAHIRAIGINAPIVVLTTDSGFEVLDALHHGAADCLIKDHLTAASLEESICAVIDHARAVESQALCERLYLSLIENTTDLIYTHDLNGNWTSINKAGEETLGYLNEEILKMNFRQLVAPEYLEVFQRTIKRLVASRKPDSQELMLITRDGERVFISIKCHLVYQEGSPIGVQGIGRLLTREPPPASLELSKREARS